MLVVKSLDLGIFSPGASVIGFTAPAKAGSGETPNVDSASDFALSAATSSGSSCTPEVISLVVKELGCGTLSPGASLIGLTAPSTAGRGFTEKSPVSTAAGVSGNAPGKSEEAFWLSGDFSFSRGTSFANSDVVEVGATPDMIPAVAGVCLTILSVVRTLFKFPDASFSWGAV